MSRHRYFLVALLMFIILNSFVFGNAAEPPALAIITPKTVKSIELFNDDVSVEMTALDKKLENQYLLYFRDVEDVEDYDFLVSLDSEEFVISGDGIELSYNTLYTLNMKDRSLVVGKSLTRSLKLILLRLSLTLLIEGVIFYIMGFRSKRSWKIFILLNLLTQGVLNFVINNNNIIDGYRMIMGLIFMEIIIFIIESVVLVTRLDEHSKIRRFTYALVANVTSYYLGAYLIRILPV